MDSLRDWLSTFGLIVIKPFPQTFVTESSKAKGKFPSAVAWVAFIAVTINIYYLLTSDYFSISKLLRQVLFIPIEILIFVFSIHFFYQRMFGKKKYLYDELLYLIVGIFVPFNLLGLLISFTMPSAGDVPFWVTLIYQLVLSVIAVQAITKLKKWQPVVVVLLGFVVALISNFILPILVLSLMSSTSSMF